jgi:hypothetical protein
MPIAYRRLREELQQMIDLLKSVWSIHERSAKTFQSGNDLSLSDRSAGALFFFLATGTPLVSFASAAHFTTQQPHPPPD